MTRNGTKKGPSFDEKKCTRLGSELASYIAMNIKPKSIGEGLFIITLTVGNVLQATGLIMGCDPKKLCKDFCEALTEYFERGGAKRLNEVYAAMQDRKKDLN